MSSDDSSEEDDWEEVPTPDAVPDVNSQTNGHQLAPYSIPSEGLVITVPRDESLVTNKGKKKFDPNEILRLHLNREIRQNQRTQHKVSLLCLLSRGIVLNQMLSSEELKARALSLLAFSNGCENPPFQINHGYLYKLVTWFRINYCPKKETSFKLHYPKLKSLELAMERSENIKCVDDDESLDHLKNMLITYLENRSKKKCAHRLHLVLLFVVFLRCVGIRTRLMWSFQPAPIKPPYKDLMQKPKSPSKEEENGKDDDGNDDDDNSSSDESSSDDSGEDTKKKGAKAKRGLKKTKRGKKGQSKAKAGPSNPLASRSRSKIISSDEEFGEELVKTKNLPEIKYKPGTGPTLGCDYWTEVYLDEDKCWISIEVLKGTMKCDKEFEADATQPMAYVLAFDNGGRVKDVTRKYASSWLTNTMKSRIESDWWEEALESLLPPPSAIDRVEDDLMDKMLLSQPVPTNISQFKNHPIYALPRHLLKFEAIYPQNAPTVGFIRGQHVYLRANVKTLQNRDSWYKQAKVVRQGEIPYKIVKSRPKFNKELAKVVKNDKPLELFGEWQTQDFIPPTAKDGKVPRNEFGNVDMFHENMLPKGTVHLMLPGLARVAKKLDIDCAAAIVGFDYSGFASRPVLDGFIVCKEYQEILLDAWNQEQDEKVKKEEEKRVDRILGNWRRLIRAVLIRERLCKRHPYLREDAESTQDQTPSTSKTVTNPTIGANSKKRKTDEKISKTAENTRKKSKK